MDYGFTGKLGVGADVDKYFAAQKAIEVQFGRVLEDEPWDRVDWKISFCPCVYRPDELRDVIESSEVVKHARVIYLCGAVDLVAFNEASDSDAQLQLMACLEEAASSIVVEDLDLMALIKAVCERKESALGASS